MAAITAALVIMVVATGATAIIVAAIAGLV